MNSPFVYSDSWEKSQLFFIRHIEYISVYLYKRFNHLKLEIMKVMKPVMLNGVEVKIGSMVRFMNDEDMYVGVSLNRPVLYGYYIVRGFSNGGFLLEGITNELQNLFTKEDETEYAMGEPAFSFGRFDVVPPRHRFKVDRDVIKSLNMNSIIYN